MERECALEFCRRARVNQWNPGEARVQNLGKIRESVVRNQKPEVGARFKLFLQSKKIPGLGPSFMRNAKKIQVGIKMARKLPASDQEG
jgi:hypothetical protein